MFLPCLKYKNTKKMNIEIQDMMLFVTFFEGSCLLFFSVQVVCVFFVLFYVSIDFADYTKTCVEQRSINCYYGIGSDRINISGL